MSKSTLGFSLFNPIQYPNRDVSIRGMRFNAFYGRNKDLMGLDLGVLSPITINTLSGQLIGGQVGFYNEVGKNSYGFQWGFINFAMDDFTGIQFSVGNITGKTTRGSQIGFINRSGTLVGLQLGVFNYADHLKGIQIGFSNLRDGPPARWPRSAPFRFSPLINWSF